MTKKNVIDFRKAYLAAKTAKMSDKEEETNVRAFLVVLALWYGCTKLAKELEEDKSKKGKSFRKALTKNGVAWLERADSMRFFKEVPFDIEMVLAWISDDKEMEQLNSSLPAHLEADMRSTMLAYVGHISAPGFVEPTVRLEFN